MFIRGRENLVPIMLVGFHLGKESFYVTKKNIEKSVKGGVIFSWRDLILTGKYKFKFRYRDHEI